MNVAPGPSGGADEGNTPDRFPRQLDGFWLLQPVEGSILLPVSQEPTTVDHQPRPYQPSVKAAVGGIALLIAVALTLSTTGRAEAVVRPDRFSPARAQLVVEPIRARSAVAPRKLDDRPDACRPEERRARSFASPARAGMVDASPIGGGLLREALLNLPPPRA